MLDVFTTLLQKLLPLYGYIAIGAVVGLKFGHYRQMAAKSLFYGVTPLIILHGTWRAELTPQLLSLPLVGWGLCTTLGLTFYKLSKRYYQDSHRNILGIAAGAGNTGYFGLPVAMLLFDETTLSAYILALLGMTLYENSVGFYLGAKTAHTTRECLKKILCLPTLHAFFLGLLLNQYPIPEQMTPLFSVARVLYTWVGMMLIGLSLSHLRGLKIDPRFLGLCFVAKFCAWPALVLTLIQLDTLAGIYPHYVHAALTLYALVPLAANSVVMATLFNAHPEKTATAVFLSTLFALVYLPLMSALLIH